MWGGVGLLALLLTSCSSSSRTQEGHTWSGKAFKAPAAPAAAEAKAAEAEGADPLPSAAEPLLKAQVYEALAKMNQAQAQQDAEGAEAALDEAMEIVRLLVRQPGVTEDAEVRELYRSVITAYEGYYGVSDTLALAYGEIFAFREEMFSTLNQLREPLLEDVMLPRTKPIPATVPLDKNRLVEQSIQYLLRSPEKHLYRWLSRAETYFPMIEQVFREEGLPDELKYLAMIESALNPRAISRAGAGGMWQFMPATGRGYGLTINHWVDERLDPEKATRAAARHLKDLYKMYNEDWQVALAGYNCSPRCIKRAIQQAGGSATSQPSFWDIYPYLPSETRNYVPMFIATVLVASDPDAFNLQPVEPGPRYTYDVVQVEGALDLRTAARLAQTDVEMIRALNPEIRQWTTPPSRAPYQLRVPRGSHQLFTAAYAALPPDQKASSAGYVVRRGDTLGKIARRYGTTVASLQEANGLRGTVIREGQRLFVPVGDDTYTGAVAASGTNHVEYDRAPVRTVSTSSTPARSAAAAAPASSRSSTRIRYRVRAGDNLTKIAQRHGVSVSDLRRWNNLSSDRIRSGQMLTLYADGAGTASPSTRSTVYVVRRGDNLTKIAQRHGVSVSDLRRWNSLSSNRILVGQRLTVQGRAAGTSSERWIAYHVKRGDNLTKIAQRHGVSVSDLRRWNSLSSNRILVGQRLAIYAP